MSVSLAVIYSAFIAGVMLFQVALIAGAPWGRLTQGGRHDGALPASGRIAAVASILILAALALAVLSASGFAPAWPRWTGWAAVFVQGVVMVANWATPSPAERKLWGPITSVMFGLALTVLLLS